MKKKILYVDMDGVLCNFDKALNEQVPADRQEHNGKYTAVPGFFLGMEPMLGAIEAFEKLSRVYDIYILSTGPWSTPGAWTEKVLWVKKYLVKAAYKRLILGHRKDLLRGDILIDDRLENGVDRFQGEVILFGSKTYPDWNSVLNHLLN
jgi:5'(3')-deoxyribonucleotidase